MEYTEAFLKDIENLVQKKDIATLLGLEVKSWLKLTTPSKKIVYAQIEVKTDTHCVVKFVDGDETAFKNSDIKFLDSTRAVVDGQLVQWEQMDDDEYENSADDILESTGSESEGEDIEDTEEEEEEDDGTETEESNSFVSEESGDEDEEDSESEAEEVVVKRPKISA